MTSSSVCAAAITMHGGPGSDILIGRLEGRHDEPQERHHFGDAGNDISIWAGGDGSDAFTGGPDAISGSPTVDRDGIVPVLTDPVPASRTAFPRPMQPARTDSALWNAFQRKLARLLVLGAFLHEGGRQRAAATMRVDEDVEQVFCTSQTTADVTLAD